MGMLQIRVRTNVITRNFEIMWPGQTLLRISPKAYSNLFEQDVNELTIVDLMLSQRLDIIMHNLYKVGSIKI